MPTAQDLIDEEFKRKAKFATQGGQVKRGKELAAQGGITFDRARSIASAKREKSRSKLLGGFAKAIHGPLISTIGDAITRRRDVKK